MEEFERAALIQLILSARAMASMIGAEDGHGHAGFDLGADRRINWKISAALWTWKLRRHDRGGFLVIDDKARAERSETAVERARFATPPHRGRISDISRWLTTVGDDLKPRAGNFARISGAASDAPAAITSTPREISR